MELVFLRIVYWDYWYNFNSELFVFGERYNVYSLVNAASGIVQGIFNIFICMVLLPVTIKHRYL